jgi:hypothetical protein
MAESVMKGGGFYSHHSGVQHTAAAPGYPMLERAATEVPFDGSQPVVIADMGCAGGRNELEPLTLAVDALRARAAHVPVVVVHSDLPENDWASLFTTIERDEHSYLAGREGVFGYAAGRSLYGALVPDGSLHLGWTGITVHWLSEMPGVVRDAIFATFASGDDRARLRDRSRRDWLGFLDHRARELVAGGQVVVVGGMASDDGTSGAEGLFRLADDELRDLVQRGVLRTSEYDEIFYPTWNRTVGEFLEPMQGDGPFAAAFSVEEVVTDRTSDAETFPQYERDGDAEAFAAAYIGFVRAITEPSFFRWLAPDRAADDRAAVVTEFYAGLQQRIAADPASATCHWQTASLRLLRRS